MPRASSTDFGLLSPLDANVELYENGLHHLYEATHLSFVKNVYGGIIFSLAGLFSVFASAGLPGLEASNPSIARLMQVLPFLLDWSLFTLWERSCKTAP